MATKMVKNLHHLPYETKLSELNLFPPNYKQLRGDLIQAYRIVRGRECALDFDEFFELAGTDSLRGHPFKLQRKLAHSDVRRNAFSHRVIGAWNGLPDAVVLYETVESFNLYTNEARFLPPSTDELPTPSVSHLLFPEGIVRRELEALNESKSPGPDEIPPKLLKELASELSVPLSMLFQTSFDTGTLPIDWKLAHITPLYKGGSRASTTNYRPISLTCILCKVMERIMKNELIDFLEVHGLLSNCQHGFRKGRSCTTNLLRSLQSWTRALDDRHEVHIAFIDFQKAFDTVPHQRLLHKLKKIGIGGNFLKWIENFLLGRHQVVCIGQGKSDPAMVGSGVSQGSVLGPILFLIYVDDAARALDCELAMFADDMKIWSVIRGPADEDILQVNLNRLEQWSSRWLLRFNVDWFFTQLYHSISKSVLTWFMTVTSANGLLNRGSMFVVSTAQFRRLLGVTSDWHAKRLLDLGAGDGKVTAKMAPLFDEVYTTEMSPVMRWRLKQANFTVLDVDKWDQLPETSDTSVSLASSSSSKPAQPQYDVVSCLNLLDRCSEPLTLLRRIREVLKPGSGLLVLALVFPLKQYVEFADGHRPVELMDVSASRVWEVQFSSFVANVLQPAGYELLAWSRVPYICEGDLARSFYSLNDVVMTLRPRIPEVAPLDTH
ncbi:Methyltransferase-like protein 9 [Sparganum proliferum]